MRTEIRLSLVVAVLVAGAGCSPQLPAGAACKSNGDCMSQMCAGLAGGYCSNDCSNHPCSGNTTCRTVGDQQLCLVNCESRADCRDGYMCWQGTCQPSCDGDTICGLGFQCTDGQCVELPGAPVGSNCERDVDCSTRYCDGATGRCEQPCLTDAACGSGKTCWINPQDADNNGFTDGIRPKCIALRNKNAPGAACKSDGECDRGSCQLGICTQMCDTSADCTGGGVPLGCQKMVAQIDDNAPTIKSCMLKSGVLDINLGSAGTGPFGFPANVQGVNIFVSTTGMNNAYYTGIEEMIDPAGKVLNEIPGTIDAFYSLPLRYQPSEATSMVLMPVSPASRPGLGVYQFTTFAASRSGAQIGYTTRIRLKLGDAPPTSGTIPLHIFVADLTGGCGVFSSEAQTAFESQIRKVFSAKNIKIDPIVYKDMPNLPSTITLSNSDVSPQLNALLKTATTGDDNDVLEVVLIKQISAGSSNGFEVLGIAGGIPASTGVPGTPHSGCAVSLSSLCYAGGNAAGGRALGVTVAHELGHTMGLFHNIEQDGYHSPLGDDVASGKANLMYWAEDSPTQIQLSPNQVMVLLGNPSVK